MTAEHLAANGDARSHRKGTRRRLNGWKEIGAFFQKNERTVKRWEQRGLPVHRLPGGANTAVFAYADELEAWLNGSRSLAQLEPPGLIIMDMALHGDKQAGLGLIQALRADARTADVPIVIHSIYVRHQSDLPRPLPQVEALLPKPFKLKQLVALVAQHCDLDDDTTDIVII